MLRLLAVGAPNRRIAQELTIGLATAESHVKRICHKLGVKTRGEAVYRAYRLGLLNFDGPLLRATRA